MFDIGWPEMLVIAVVLIVVVGPKDLPRMLRTFGKTTSNLRRMAGDFRKQFDEALKEAELDDVKSTIDSARKLNPAADIRKALNPMEQAANEVRAGLDGMMKPQAPPKVPPADAPAAAAEPAKTGPAAMPGEATAAPAPIAEAAVAPATPATGKPAAALPDAPKPVANGHAGAPLPPADATRPASTSTGTSS
jgi:sec-independent protein translocase protein TatB